jgi:hypothetical protein
VRSSAKPADPTPVDVHSSRSRGPVGLILPQGTSAVSAEYSRMEMVYHFGWVASFQENAAIRTGETAAFLQTIIAGNVKQRRETGTRCGNRDAA